MKKAIWKNALALVLCVALLGTAMPVAFADAATITTSYSTSKQYLGSGFDSTNAYRGENMLILFTDDFEPTTSSYWWYFQSNYIEGSHTTCTNPYGYEVVVNQWGYVTSVGGNNNVIPDGGYVLSANGTKATELKENVAVGDYIRVGAYPSLVVYRVTDDDKRASVAYSADSNDTQSISYTMLAGGSYASGVTVGGDGVTTGSTVWQNDVLVKITATGADSTKAGAGYVVSVGGNDIEVPEGYFAITLSGQTVTDDGGEPSYNGAQWFKDYAPVGTIINLGANEIFIRHDNAAAVRAAKLLAGVTDTTLSHPITAVETCAITNIVNDLQTSFALVDIDTINSLYSDMQEIAKSVSASDSNLAAKVATIYQDYNKIYALSAEQRTVEYRATWVRAFNAPDAAGKTAEELDAIVEASVDKVAKNGYNMIFLEVFYNSTTIMPMNGAGYDGLSYQQNPYLTPEGNSNLTENYDVLQKYIDVCHERGIELHVWMESFYVGYKRTNGLTDSLFDYSIAKAIEDNPTRYAGWLNEASDGSNYFGAESDGALQYFLNPHSTGARTFLLNTFRYIWNNYDIDGFQLDYIRYPKTGTKCFGYDADTLAAFRQAYPAYANYTDAQLQSSSFFYNADWIQFRADCVTSFVGTVHETMQSDRPDLYLTAATGSDYTEAKNTLMQDLQTWFNNGYIDILFPMAYGENVVKDSTAKLVAGNPTKFACSGVSGSYNAELEYKWLLQVREAGADGVGVFGMTDSYYECGVFAVQAITPTGNAAKAAMTYLEDTVKARALKMKEAGAITTAKYKSILAACDQMISTVKQNGIEGAADEITALHTLADSLTNANAKAALNADADYLQKIKNNSHDVYSQAHDTAGGTGLFVNGVDLSQAGEDFTYVAATKTLVIKTDGAVLSGTLDRAVDLVVADGVQTLELENATITATDESEAIAASGELTVELTGENVINAKALSSATITYIGTGVLKQGDTVVMRKGDVVDDDTLDTSDVRLMMESVVGAKKLTTEQIGVGDADGDGKVSTIDARIFLSVLMRS